MCLLMSSLSLITTASAQDQPSRFSVYGPPQPAVWEFQLAAEREPTDVIGGFNLYRKNQRQKTHFFSLHEARDDRGHATGELQFTGGLVLFPYRNDDRFQFELGGSVINPKHSPIQSNYMGRVTLRPEKWLWIRGGVEGLRDGTGEDNGSIQTDVQYGALKFALGSWQVTGASGRTGRDSGQPGLSGAALLRILPGNFFVFGGLLRGGPPAETVRTIALGRWAPFRPDGLAALFYIWKHRTHYDFHLAGLFYGRHNLFVRPAALGMTQGIFLSDLGIRENSNLRRRQLMTITDESRNADVSIFFVSLDQQIEMYPGQLSRIGFKTLMVFKLFPDSRFNGISTPNLGLIWTAETSPVFDPANRSFDDQSRQTYSWQIGFYFRERHLISLIANLNGNEWIAAYSFFVR